MSFSMVSLGRRLEPPRGSAARVTNLDIVGYISIPSTNGGGSCASSQNADGRDEDAGKVRSVAMLNGESEGCSGRACSAACGNIYLGGRMDEWPVARAPLCLTNMRLGT